MLRVLLLSVAAALSGCGGTDREATSPTVQDTGPERVFAYSAIDGSRFDSETTRGRYTVLLFLTTYDLSCQLAARQLEDLYRRHVPRINAGVVVLEPPQDQLLVEAFVSTLTLSYPVALADRLTLVGDSAFGRISTIPTYVVLSPRGREIWRSSGWASPEAVEGKLR